MKDRIAAAFDAACDKYSADRVVADPELNQRFVQACRKHGLNEPVGELNRLLLNLRKQGYLAGRPRAKRTRFRNEDEYRFAAEMAARHLERRDGVSLDQIICDPGIAQEFDKLAESISPGFSSLQYRWAALNLRKASRFRPEILSRVAAPVEVTVFRCDRIDITRLPKAQGLYLFCTSDEALYVGETQDLHQRIRKHLDHSDNRGLARWLWEHGPESVVLEIQVLEGSTTTRIRRALETELIRSRQPLFNVQR